MRSALPARATFDVDVNTQAPAAARRQILLMAPMRSIDDDLRAEIQLLLSELVTNVVAHEHADRITVDAVLSAAGAVTVTVTGGAGAAPAVYAAPQLPAAGAQHGRGLYLVDAIAADWGTTWRDGRTSVWFTVAGDSLSRR